MAPVVFTRCDPLRAPSHMTKRKKGSPRWKKDQNSENKARIISWLQSCGDDELLATIKRLAGDRQWAAFANAIVSKWRRAGGKKEAVHFLSNSQHALDVHRVLFSTPTPLPSDSAATAAVAANDHEPEIVAVKSSSEMISDAVSQALARDRVVVLDDDDDEPRGLVRPPDSALSKRRCKAPCAPFLRGTCTAGASCLFSHDVAAVFFDARPSVSSVAPVKAPCAPFLRGACKAGAACAFSHFRGDIFG